MGKEKCDCKMGWRWVEIWPCAMLGAGRGRCTGRALKTDTIFWIRLAETDGSTCHADKFTSIEKEFSQRQKLTLTNDCHKKFKLK